ncbi:protein of unknown function (plasmid) [Cupriavidus taiwanensis]|uniref:Integrase catalytic domain-containing protein n=1 Tax=Cupriavidus taiwanensis TaxID=164546 RepID=A0A375FHK1_9BURK|nr:hypothetical protein CBM2614_U10007 [Cupriavidus taiwanensis]SOZ73289.1 hypothetical protein CBM2615_U10004 [Cupriavidus taiwanensis]SOZ75214.1 hypothetical protein CBM2613_U10116 [Cupriavidus taiwanensis]SPA03679.1 protein of unknown function [Cupriavidus taiwanensis]SPA11577.1 protein of unknown function [Cupriavidus taiwanensis]
MFGLDAGLGVYLHREAVAISEGIGGGQVCTATGRAEPGVQLGHHYIWTEEGWLYLAVVLDLFNREVVGWSIKPPMAANLVTDALALAWFRRRPAPGALYHGYRGSQYASQEFQRLKNERVHSTRYRMQREAAADLFEYIEVFYNRSGRHSSLGYVIAGPAPAGLAHCSAGERYGCITRDLWNAKTEGTSLVSSIAGVGKKPRSRCSSERGGESNASRYS